MSFYSNFIQEWGELCFMFGVDFLHHLHSETLYPYPLITSNLSFQNVVDSFSPLLEFNSMATTWCLHEHHLAETSPPFEARSALFLEIWGLRRLVA